MSNDMTAVGRIIAAGRRSPLLFRSVIVVLLAGCLTVLAATIAGLVHYTDVSNFDSAILLRVGDFATSGRIYPQFDRPPYLVTIYGPLTYALLGIPYKLAQSAGICPQVPVRIAVAIALSACVALTYLLSRQLRNSRATALLCALFAISVSPLVDWSTAVRGDFLALAFSLLSIYVFNSRKGLPQAVGAGICAGLAPLVKQTFVAAPIAIFIWSIYRRRYKEGIAWAASVAVTIAGGYAVAWVREPLMLQHMAALSRPVFEYRQALAIVGYAASQPVVPFALMGIFLALRNRSDEGEVLVIYIAVAWLIACATIPQVGGNINYFWEPLFASAVFAGPGLRQLQRRAVVAPLSITILLLFLLLQWFVPLLRSDLSSIRQSCRTLSNHRADKMKWESFVAAVSGRRVLSTVSRVSVLSTRPELPDSYFSTCLELHGMWDSRPVVAEIKAGHYDLIVIKKGQAEGIGGWRGVLPWSREMWQSVKESYAPACTFEGFEIWLPRRGTASILPRLLAIGCTPMPPAPGSPRLL